MDMKKETIFEKYQRVRPQIEDGDIAYFHGTGIIARIIQWFDRSYYNHVGVVFEKFGTLYIMDANGNGVECDRFSFRIGKYSKGGDFTIGKPLCDKYIIRLELAKLLKRGDNWVKYDFKNGIKELLNRRFRLNLKIYLNDKKDICSDYISEYQKNTKMVDYRFSLLRLVFPQDGVRYSTDLVKFVN